MSAKVYALKRTDKVKVWTRVSDNLVRHEPSGVYYVRKFKKGKGELFKTTGTSKKLLAQTRADEMVAEWLGGRIPTQGRQKRIDAICDELEEYLANEAKNGDRRQKTAGKDPVYLKQIRELFGEYSASEIDEDFWEDWINRKGRKLNRTLFDLAKYLSKVLTFAHRRKYIGRKPAIRNPDKQSKKGRILTDAEVRALIAACDERTLAQLTLGYENGLRTSEVRAMRKEFVAFQTNGRGEEVAILNLPEWFVKANARTIQLSPGSCKVLRGLIEKGDRGSPFVFPSPKDPSKPETAVYQNRRWRKIVKKAGLTGRVWFYHLRHTFYNKTLLELGLPVQQVSEYGGTSIRTLQKAYLKADSSRTSVVSLAVKLPNKEKLK